MKVIKITEQTHFVRYRFKWYRVQRQGNRWMPLDKLIERGREAEPAVDPIEHAAEMLKKRGSGSVKPPIDLTE